MKLVHTGQETNWSHLNVFLKQLDWKYKDVTYLIASTTTCLLPQPPSPFNDESHSCHGVLCNFTVDNCSTWNIIKKKTPWSETASELYRPSDRRLSTKWLPTFADRGVPRGLRDGSLRPYSRFSRQEPLFFYQVAPQLYSRGWVDPVQDPLLFFCSAGNRTRASGSVANNSDH
jgi:hypothetical protein